MGSNRTRIPRIVNTPEGPRERTRMAGESMERDQRRIRRRGAFSPMDRKRMFTQDKEERMQDKDMEARREERKKRREERKQTFGDSFREQRKERRRSRREMDEGSGENRRIFRKITTRAERSERRRRNRTKMAPTKKDQNIAGKEI